MTAHSFQVLFGDENMRTTEEHYAHFHKVAQACFWYKKRPRTLLNEVYYTTDFIYLVAGVKGLKVNKINNLQAIASKVPPRLK